MRCSRARAAILERQLGTLAPLRQRTLTAHLDSCAACAAAARLERSITAALGELHRECPVEIDATATVMARIATLGPADHAEVPDRHIAWGAAAALAAGVALLASGTQFLPYLPRAAALLAALGRGLFTVVSDFAAVLAELAAVPLRVLASEAALRALATGVVPVAVAVVAAACLLMVTTTAVVVGRDLIRPGAGARGMLI